MIAQETKEGQSPEIVITVATDFARAPGGRLAKFGPASGEEFRQRVLAPQLRKARAEGRIVTVRLDGAAGYAGSFLEEAFAGLIRNEGFTWRELEKILKVEAAGKIYLRFKALAEEYMLIAGRRQEAN